MNLLPQEKKEILKKGLKLRFAVVLLFLVSASLLLGLVMLLPSYFLVSGHLGALALEDKDNAGQSENIEREILDAPAEINEKLQFFQAELADTGAIDSLSKIMDLLPEGVKLNIISFSKHPANGTDGKSVLISGVSSDRDSLLKFGNALKESGQFQSVEVPVSSFTKERNLDFSINISIAN